MHNQARATAAQIQDEVIRGASTGLRILNNILTEGTIEYEQADVKLRAKVAHDFLDREGSAPRITRSQAESRNLSVHLDANDIEFLKEEAAKQRAEDPRQGAFAQRAPSAKDPLA